MDNMKSAARGDVDAGEKCFSFVGPRQLEDWPHLRWSCSDHERNEPLCDVNECSRGECYSEGESYGAVPWRLP